MDSWGQCDCDPECNCLNDGSRARISELEAEVDSRAAVFKTENEWRRRLETENERLREELEAEESVCTDAVNGVMRDEIIISQKEELCLRDAEIERLQEKVEWLENEACPHCNGEALLIAAGERNEALRARLEGAVELSDVDRRLIRAAIQPGVRLTCKLSTELDAKLKGELDEV